MKHEDRLGAENGGSGRPENSYCQRLVPCYMEMMLLFTFKCRESRVSAQLRKVGTVSMRTAGVRSEVRMGRQTH